MVRLKKYRVHKAICEVCKGNGYVKVIHIDEKDHIHQCWECDSEGEFYVYEDNPIYGNRNTYKFLH
jgi:hypothetical protein